MVPPFFVVWVLCFSLPCPSIAFHGVSGLFRCPSVLFVAYPSRINALLCFSLPLRRVVHPFLASLFRCASAHVPSQPFHCDSSPFLAVSMPFISVQFRFVSRPVRSGRFVANPSPVVSLPINSHAFHGTAFLLHRVSVPSLQSYSFPLRLQSSPVRSAHICSVASPIQSAPLRSSPLRLQSATLRSAPLRLSALPISAAQFPFPSLLIAAILCNPLSAPFCVAPALRSAVHAVIEYVRHID